jgi:small ligand-binding sensory domain FIST
MAKIGAAVASFGKATDPVEEVLSAASAPLAGEAPDLGFVFATNHYEDELEQIAARIREQLGVRTLIGCTGEGVIGPQGEVESGPAVALWLARLPGVVVNPVSLDQADLEVADTPEAFRRLLPLSQTRTEDGLGFAPTLFLLADPFSFNIVQFLETINAVYPDVRVLGGMTSGVEAPDQSVLICNEECHRQGAVGVVVSGSTRIDPVVSQGCRPIGRPFVITAAEENILKQLGGKPALAILNDVFQHASEDERRLMQQGIFVGQAITEYKEHFGRGDFLVRNLVGADQSSGALAVGDYVRIGRTMQFHVRDARSADADLQTMLSPYASEPTLGALMFTCNGRGTRLFDTPDHDLNALRAVTGPLPIAGLFCAGEIGPVGGQNYVHGHTASIALFRPPAADQR